MFASGVTRSSNEKRRDGDAATLVAQQVLSVHLCFPHHRYEGHVCAVGGSGEHGAIAGILTTCGRAAAAPKSPPASATLPPSPTSPWPVTAPAPTSGSSVYYPDCKAVRNAVAAPLNAGQPGYRPGLDRDRDRGGDVIACE